MLNLRTLNPHWPARQLYNVARKIVGAMLQKISFHEYLPNILGKKKTHFDSAGYDANTEAGVLKHLCVST